MLPTHSVGLSKKGPTVKLWFIHQDANTNYDTYDSAVVAAETEDEARRIHPGGDEFDAKRGVWPGWFDKKSVNSSWAPSLSDVSARLIGEAVEGTEAGRIICASFNAG